MVRVRVRARPMHLVGREALAHDEDGEESGPQDLTLVGHLVRVRARARVRVRVRVSDRARARARARATVGANLVLLGEP